MRWFAAVLCACSGGGDPAGKAGEAGDSGPNSGLVWVDADGVVVDGVVYLGAQLSYVDVDGYLWALDPWASGGDAFLTAPSDRQTCIVFADSACTEPWLTIVPPAPRIVVIASSPSCAPPEGYDGAAFVALDDAEEAQLSPTFVLSGAVCEEDESIGRVAAADLVEVYPPPTTWAAPLHPEWR